MLPWEIRAHPPEFLAAHPELPDARADAAALLFHGVHELLRDYRTRAGVTARDEAGTEFPQ